ncbi:MAG: 2Fe-2S iron-sulfur cluster-binding protein, partial [Bacteroidota bacterium]|nr:2Fe-2S iron-sulfur cluster-binding protein [Bacteroidota bacterium]
MVLLAFDLTTIITSVIVFLVFSVLLISLILFAKAKLTASGPVKILINGQNIVEAEGGSSLLTTLANQKIFLPSACGGGGTCAMCK